MSIHQSLRIVPDSCCQLIMVTGQGGGRASGEAALSETWGFPGLTPCVWSPEGSRAAMALA